MDFGHWKYGSPADSFFFPSVAMPFLTYLPGLVSMRGAWMIAQYHRQTGMTSRFLIIAESVEFLRVTAPMMTCTSAQPHQRSPGLRRRVASRRVAFLGSCRPWRLAARWPRASAGQPRFTQDSGSLGKK